MGRQRGRRKREAIEAAMATGVVPFTPTTMYGDVIRVRTPLAHQPAIAITDKQLAVELAKQVGDAKGASFVLRRHSTPTVLAVINCADASAAGELHATLEALARTYHPQ